MAPPPDPESGQQRFDEQHLRDLAAAAGSGRKPDPAERGRLLEAARRGEHDAREELVRVHLDLVVSAACERADRGLSESDLFQEGTIGLIEAIQAFPASGRGDFEAFASELVARHMDQALGDEEKAVRDTQMLLQAAQDYVKAEVNAREELGRLPTNVELATKLEWSARRTEEIGHMVADARRRHDVDILQYIVLEDIDLDGVTEDQNDADGR